MPALSVHSKQQHWEKLLVDEKMRITQNYDETLSVWLENLAAANVLKLLNIILKNIATEVLLVFINFTLMEASILASCI